MMKVKRADKYSKALIRLADSKEGLEKQLSEFEWLLYTLKEVPMLKQFLNHRLIQAEEKKKALEKLFNNSHNDQILDFLCFLIDKKRINDLEIIIEEHRSLAKEKLGIIEAHLVTAIPIDGKIEEKIKGELETFYRQKVEIQSKINPQILGGIVLTVGNKILDNSVRNQFIELKNYLSADEFQNKF